MNFQRVLKNNACMLILCLVNQLDTSLQTALEPSQMLQNNRSTKVGKNVMVGDYIKETMKETMLIRPSVENPAAFSNVTPCPTK